MTTDAKILVRKAELACRDSWGNDFWADDSSPEGEEPMPPAIEPVMPDEPVAAEPLAATIGPNPGGFALEDDLSFNDAAHLDQEARAAAMRHSPSEALRLAWGRKAPKRQSAPSSPASSEITTTPDEPATPAITPGIDRLVTAPVPVSEVSSDHQRESDDKYHSIPEIRHDIELPLLQNRFHLSRQSAPESPPAAPMSSYDRALQNALAFKARQQGAAQQPVDDLEIPSHPPPPVPVPTSLVETEPPDDEPEDEIVSVRTTTGVSISRFERSPVIAYDDPLDELLEDDVELDRMYRPEPSQQQIGQRWWETVRQKVLGTGLRTSTNNHSFDDDEDEFADQEWHTDQDFDESSTGEVDGEFTGKAFASGNDALVDENATIEAVSFTQETSFAHHETIGTMQPDVPVITDTVWADPAPESGSGVPYTPPPPRTRLMAGEIWGSTHEYLTSDQDPAAPLEPMVWRDEPVVTHTAPTNDFDWDSTPATELSADFRERLFGEVAESGPTISRQNRAAEPGTRVPPVADRPPGPAAIAGETVDAADDPGEPLLDRTVEIGQGIPRMCQTCRSFRPAEDGSARGWCTNQWAFGHRRLVNAEDLACESTMGVWWLPADEDWDIDGLLVRLAQQTPRTDQLTATLHRESRRSG